MSEHVFKPGDTAVITANDARGATEPEDPGYDIAEGDVVEVLSHLDSDGDYYVWTAQRTGFYIAPRYLAPADEPAPYYGPCNADRVHPLFDLVRSCHFDAAEYVEVHADATYLMRLCTGHAQQAAKLPGFVSRRPLTTPRPRPEEGVPLHRGHGTHPSNEGKCYCGYPKTTCAGYAAAVREAAEAKEAAATAPRCTYGADCQVHPDENRLHNHDRDDLGQIVARLDKLEARLQGVIETHHLWDGS